MAHSDDNGLVLPPKLAPYQVIIVPIYKKTEQLAAISEKVDEIMAQLKQKGIDVNFSEILTDIAERDQRDSQRDASPMKPTADAIVLDTSNLSINEVVEQVLGLYRSYVKVS